MRRNLGVAVRQQHKLVLLFIATIGVPAALLGVFGLRALEADRIRLEESARRDLREALANLRSALAAEVRQGGEVLDRLAGLPALGTEDWASLRRSTRELPLRAEVVASLPAGGLVFVSAGYRVGAAEDGERAAGLLRGAEDDEFGRSDPERAGREYARLAASAASRLRLEALRALGRLHFRLGRYAQAAESYRRILDAWPEPGDAMSSRLPPLAGLQLAACLDKLGRREAALGARVETYAALVDRRWVQPPDAAEYYLERFEAEIGPACARLGATSPPCSRYARARARRAGVLEQARQIETLGRELAPVLGWIHTDPSAAGMRLLHLRKSGRLAVARRATERSATAGAPVLALLLDVPTLLESALRAPGLERIRTGEVALRVSGPDGNLLYNRDSQPVEGPVLVDSLGEGLPDCKAVLRRQPPDSERGFLAARRNLYLALTALLLGLLLFGGFAVFRTVLQEAELVAVKSNLVSLVSHEFRNPIASIRTLVERLQAGYVTDAARKQQYFDVIAGELQRLTRLVNNFLDFSQIDAGRKAYHPIETDLPALLGEVLAPFEARASQQGFRIETSVEVPIPAVRVDRDAIAQAILNLLDNALKYSTRDKRIDVRVRHAGGVVLVEVKDHGDGIDTNDLPHVFEAAYRTSDAARRNVPGVGLGLAIVKHVMTRHGGDVTVDSAPDGTTFALRIPAPAPTDAVRAPGAVPAVR